MPAYSLINEKLLSTTLANEKVFVRRGAMLAYRGEIDFAPAMLAGGGVQDLAARTVTSEGLYLMSGSGTGEAFFGHAGRYVTIVALEGETLYVESSSVLAFDQRLRAGTMFLGNQGLQGIARGAMSGQGLFTSTFEGRGEVAILSDGHTIALEVRPDMPVFSDPDAYIAHKGQLDSRINTDMGWKTLLGQGSGESFQLKFEGTGTVYIQASER